MDALLSLFKCIVLLSIAHLVCYHPHPHLLCTLTALVHDYRIFSCSLDPSILGRSLALQINVREGRFPSSLRNSPATSFMSIAYWPRGGEWGWPCLKLVYT